MKKENIIIVLNIIILLLILVVYALGVYYYFYYEEEMIEPIVEIEEDFIVQEESNQEKIVCPEVSKDTSFFVEIKGEVAKPGVYKVDSNNIVNDVIKLAGGLTKNAYTDNINMSHHLSSEMVIYVYSKNVWEDKHKEKESEIVFKQEECVCETVEISVCEEKGESIIVVEPQDSNTSVEKEETNIEPKNDEQEQNDLININTASLEELKTLTGIGDAKAQKIVEYRSLNGLFSSIDEIMNVSGISENVYAKIKDYITV